MPESLFGATILGTKSEEVEKQRQEEKEKLKEEKEERLEKNKQWRAKYRISI